MNKFVGSASVGKRFWSCIKANDPRRLENPAFDRPNLHSKGLPITVYGDGVQLGGHCSKSSYKNVCMEGVLGDDDGLSNENCHYLGGWFNECAVLPS